MTTANEFNEKGNKALAAGKEEEAVEHYSSAIARDSSNFILYSNRSAAYCKLQEYQKALVDANECIRLKPDWSKVRGAKGVCLLLLVGLKVSSRSLDSLLQIKKSVGIGNPFMMYAH